MYGVMSCWYCSCRKLYIRHLYKVIVLNMKQVMLVFLSSSNFTGTVHNNCKYSPDEELHM